MSENTVWKTMTEIDNVTTTTNGDKAYKSTLNGLMDLMFKAGIMRNSDLRDCVNLFKNAYDENPLYAIRLLFYVRDVRGGQGCRNFFRNVMKYLASSKPEIFEKIIDYIPEYGRWDDLVDLFEFNEEKILNSIKTQLKKDIENIMNNKPISLLMKWLPSENTSSKETVKLAKKIRKAMNMCSKDYRQILSKGRKYLNIVEHNVCENNFKDLDYSKVPSLAMMKYKNIFTNKDAKNFQKYVQDVMEGKKKINAKVLYPYDIITNYIKERWNNNDKTVVDLLNEQWKNLPDFFNGKKDNSIVVADVSGSMTGTPMNVCISLALYIAERNKGAFHNKVITFSESPTLVELSNNFTSLEDRINEMENINWGMNTDLDKVFKLLFNSIQNGAKIEDLPSTIYIISDMQFDECITGGNESTFEKWTRKFNEIGCKLPRIIFWNVSEYNSNSVPITIKDNGTIVISGFSPSILKYVMTDTITNTIKLIEEIVFSDRYKNINI